MLLFILLGLFFKRLRCFSFDDKHEDEDENDEDEDDGDDVNKSNQIEKKDQN